LAVTTAPEAGNPTSATDSPWRSIVIFLVLTACLSGIFWAFVKLTQTVTALDASTCSSGNRSPRCTGHFVPLTTERADGGVVGQTQCAARLN